MQFWSKYCVKCDNISLRQMVFIDIGGHFVMPLHLSQYLWYFLWLPHIASGNDSVCDCDGCATISHENKAIACVVCCGSSAPWNGLFYIYYMRRASFRLNFNFMGNCVYGMFIGFFFLSQLLLFLLLLAGVVFFCMLCYYLVLLLTIGISNETYVTTYDNIE